MTAIAEDSTPTAPSSSTTRFRGAVVCASLGITVAVMDGMVVNVLLPTIAAYLHVAAATAIWVVTTYQIALMSALLCFASVGDRIGARSVYLAGLVVFAVASVASWRATSVTALAAARFLQGLGAAGIMSVNTSLLRQIYPPARLGTGLGYNALLTAMAAAIAPLLCGLTTSRQDYRIVFLIYVPFLVLAIGLGVAFLPRRGDDPRTGPSPAGYGVGIGEIGTVIATAASFVALTALLGRSGRAGPTITVAATFAACLALMIAASRRRARPIFPADLFAQAGFRRAAGSSVGAFAGQIVAFTTIPFYLATCKGATVLQIGLVMTCWPVSVAVAALVAGRMSDRMDARALSSAGSAVLACGLTGAAAALWTGAPGMLVAALVGCGAGFGVFQVPNNKILVGSAPSGRGGAASGMLGMSRLVGQTLGVTITTLVIARFGLSPSTAAAALLAAAAFAVVPGLCLRHVEPVGRLAAPTLRKG